MSNTNAKVSYLFKTSFMEASCLVLLYAYIYARMFLCPYVNILFSLAVSRATCRFFRSLKPIQCEMLEVILVYVPLAIAVFYAIAWTYCKTTMGVCKSKRDLSGRTVIVTGANTGIGLETARNLASRNARVILACRDIFRGEAAKQDIVNSTGNHKVVVKELDLSSFQSVRSFANDFLKSERRLDVLVNNAGVTGIPFQKKSAEGVNMIMATNHYGPFLLTNLLLPKLKENAPSRIVVVSSFTYAMAKKVLNETGEEIKNLTPIKLYNMSKLANVLFTCELSNKLKDTGVTVNSLHPGAIKTELQRNIKSLFLKVIITCIRPFMKNAQQGAQTSVYVAVAEELEGVSGKYFSDCKEKKLKEHAIDNKAAKRLWKYSENVTGLTPSM